MHPITHVPIQIYTLLWQCAPSPMCPIVHVPHCSCGLLPMCPITLLPCRPRRIMLHHPNAPSLLFPITHMPNHPTPCAHVPHRSCGLLPMHPITHVPHPDLYIIMAVCPITHVSHCPCVPSPMCPIPQGAPSLSSVLTRIPICPRVPLPICPKRCKVVKKMSNLKKSNTWTMEEVHKKMNSHEVHTYWYQFWHHIWWWPKTLKICIESVFEQFWWPSYSTSKLTSICVNLIMWIYFFVNLLHSLCVSLFDIWHLFDILTSFWHFDIFFNLNHLSRCHINKEFVHVHACKYIYFDDLLNKFVYFGRACNSGALVSQKWGVQGRMGENRGTMHTGVFRRFRWYGRGDAQWIEYGLFKIHFKLKNKLL